MISHVLEGVVYVEDAKAYIHYHIEDLGTSKIKGKSELIGESGKIKLTYQHIEELGFTDILDILEFEDEITRYVLSRVHGEFIWLDRSYKITKEDIQAITGFSSVGQHLDKKVSNNFTRKITDTTSDKRSMKVSTITNIDIKFGSMIIGYKVTQSNQLNFVSSSCILAAYKMIRDNVKLDLCGWILDELLISLGKTNGDKKGTFQYGNLLVCLMLYFLNDTPGSSKKQWAFDIPIGRQLKQSIAALGSQRDDKIWGYFKSFQKSMRSRVRVPKHIVEKYSTNICFMVKKDETLMEAIKPQKIWIEEMGYEVDGQILDAYTKMLIDAPIDEADKPYGTAQQKTLEVET